MRVRWSNRVAVIDGLIDFGNLEEGKKQAKELLTELDALVMLSEREIAYLKLIVNLCGTEDDTGDTRNGEEAKDN